MSTRTLKRAKQLTKSMMKEVEVEEETARKNNNNPIAQENENNENNNLNVLTDTKMTAA
jgi:hypothetical protein